MWMRRKEMKRRRGRRGADFGFVCVCVFLCTLGLCGEGARSEPLLWLAHQFVVALSLYGGN